MSTTLIAEPSIISYTPTSERTAREEYRAQLMQHVHAESGNRFGMRFPHGIEFADLEYLIPSLYFSTPEEPKDMNAVYNGKYSRLMSERFIVQGTSSHRTDTPVRGGKFGACGLTHEELTDVIKRLVELRFKPLELLS